VAEKGQQNDFKLPDGSLVSLNADTKITFSKNRFKQKRNVEMEGEAFFNIQKGSTFTITTNLAEIKILGTSFNVYARDNQFKVSCFTGKIRVTSGEQSEIIIPNETAYIENNKLMVIKEENINSTAIWRVGEFNYENIPLNLVFNEIERQFNVTFVLPNFEGKKFTGSFSNKNLVQALDIICIPMGLTYEIGSNSKITIKGKTD
jgi:transmembrane sensor